MGQHVADIKDVRTDSPSRSPVRATKLDMRVIKAEVDRQFKEMHGSIIANGIKQVMAGVIE